MWVWEKKSKCDTPENGTVGVWRRKVKADTPGNRIVGVWEKKLWCDTHKKRNVGINHKTGINITHAHVTLYIICGTISRQY